MLWLAIDLPRLPFDALSLDDNAPCVVTLTQKRRRTILAGSQAAEKLQFTPGMDYATAATLCSNLLGVARNPRAERAALERLAAWGYQWSSSVTFAQAAADALEESSTLWLEIAASFKLFGGRSALLKRIEEELSALGYRYRLGVAGSLEGAALLARARQRVIAATPASLRRHIAKLPVDLLALERSIVFELQRAGIRTIGACIELPKAALARRFGPATSEYLDRLLGLANDPRPAFQLPKKYRARLELSAEVASVEALLFPLRRMLSELQGYLRAIDCGLQRFILHLQHRGSVTRIPIGFSTPERRAEQFFAIVRERFERLELSAPVIGIALQADRFMAPKVKQTGIFSDTERAENFSEVLDRLNARLGAEAIHYVRAIADHRPERAWQQCETQSARHEVVAAPRPLWLLDEPQRIPEPKLFASTAERIEGGWWDSGDIERDYFIVPAPTGARLWVYRDNKTAEWFLHGLFG